MDHDCWFFSDTLMNLKVSESLTGQTQHFTCEVSDQGSQRLWKTYWPFASDPMWQNPTPPQAKLLLLQKCFMCYFIMMSLFSKMQLSQHASDTNQQKVQGPHPFYCLLISASHWDDYCKYLLFDHDSDQRFACNINHDRFPAWRSP
jgi:hypothetical protein